MLAAGHEQQYKQCSPLCLPYEQYYTQHPRCQFSCIMPGKRHSWYFRKQMIMTKAITCQAHIQCPKVLCGSQLFCSASCAGTPLPSEKQQLKLRREKWRICKGLLPFFFLNLRLPLFLFWSEMHSYPSKAKQLSTTSPQRGRDDLNGDQRECVLRHPQHVLEAQGTFHLTQTWA